MNKILFLFLVAFIFASVSARAQNFYLPNATPSTEPGLTNPSGSTVFVPNYPARPLGGTPPPLTGHNANSDVISPNPNNPAPMATDDVYYNKAGLPQPGAKQ